MGLDLKGQYKADNWKGYRQRWENYSIITQLDKQTEDYKVALFLYCIGPETVKTYNSFDLSPENRRNLTLIIEEFEKYAVGDVNETYERFIFNSRSQQDGESVDEYVTHLRHLARSCNFCSCLQDSLIRDRVVRYSRRSHAKTPFTARKINPSKMHRHLPYRRSIDLTNQAYGPAT